LDVIRLGIGDCGFWLGNRVVQPTEWCKDSWSTKISFFVAIQSDGIVKNQIKVTSYHSLGGVFQFGDIHENGIEHKGY
jgi:hypothetical protein